MMKNLFFCLLQSKQSMKNTINTLQEIIRQRRSIFPIMYDSREISNEVLLEICDNGNWAPNHRKTEPWRFKVLKGAKQHALGPFLAEYYKSHTPVENFKQAKYEKMIKKPAVGGAMIIICMQRDPKQRVEEWEEIAAVSMAVQNMWLTCHTHNIGAYWGTPASRHVMNEFVDMEDGEICLGLLFMGYLKEDTPKNPGTRGNINDKITWYTDE